MKNSSAKLACDPHCGFVLCPDCWSWPDLCLISIPAQSGRWFRCPAFWISP